MSRYDVHVACDSDIEGYECCSGASDTYDTLDDALDAAARWSPPIWSTSIYDNEACRWIPQPFDEHTRLWEDEIRSSANPSGNADE